MNLMVKQVTQCPVCDAALRITELSCSVCETRLHGDFPPPPLARLPAEHQDFILTFVRCRGIIRDVERTLGISYPTVRARLDAVVAALDEIRVDTAPKKPSPLPAPDARRDTLRRALLRQVSEGEIDPAEAAEALRTL